MRRTAAGWLQLRNQQDLRHELVSHQLDLELGWFDRQSIGDLLSVADNDAERARGLMYRRSMADNSGMLFDFGNERDITMWMRNTYISLDMLFIDANGRIGHIAANTTPLSDTVISSRIKAQFVLEINAGIARRQGIEVGDRVHGPAIDDRL